MFAARWSFFIVLLFLCFTIMIYSKPEKKIKETNPEVIHNKPDVERMKGFYIKEMQARTRMLEAEKEFGKDSENYFNELSMVGALVYKQWQWEEAFALSKEIVIRSEKVHGKDSEKTARFLINLASAADWLKQRDYCEIAMKRAAYIFLQLFDETHKEIIWIRGKMLGYSLRDARTTKGLEYDDYRYELEYYQYDKEL